ncbi:MAG: hypothetical protein ACI9SY_000608 [Candidatus Paceibacteria bacterium]|jgi:hypothetical protein
MSQKWNLQDIRPAGQARPKRRPTQKSKLISSDVERTSDVGDESIPVRSRSRMRPRNDGPQIVIEDATNKDRNRMVMAVVFFVVVVGAAALLSSLLGKTELTIYPEFRDPNINAEFTAQPTPTDGTLSYEIMTLEETKESQVQASGSIDVEEQATGVLEISKSTPGAERLIKNTRFRSPEGLVYRIQESVVVPGAVDGNPGTIQAEVFADEIGQEYNVSAGTQFDIPGFEEGGFMDLFRSISASNPAAVTGGFDGPQFQIDEGELNTARQAIQIELRNALLESIDSSKPAGMISFPGAVAITYNQLPAIEYGQDLVTIREQAVLQIPLFQADDFGTFLAKEAVATYDGGPVRVDDPSQLVFRYSTATNSNSVIANADSLTFNLTGKPRLIWEYDADKLTTDLAGLPKTAISNAISAYPGIERARVQVTPFWKRTFPENAEEIEVIEIIEEAK